MKKSFPSCPSIVAVVQPTLRVGTGKTAQLPGDSKGTRTATELELEDVGDVARFKTSARPF